MKVTTRWLLVLAWLPTWLHAAPPADPPAAVDLPPAAGQPVATTVAQNPAGQPAVVSRVQITGLETIDEKVVRDAMTLKVGLPFTAEGLQADVDRIYALGWFFFDKENQNRGSVVTRRTDADGNVEIHMVLVENPPVVEIRYLGVDKQLSGPAVTDRVAWLKIGRPLNTSPARVAAALREIETLYRELYQIDVVASVSSGTEQPPFYERSGEKGVAVNIKLQQRGGGGTRPVETPPVTPGGTPGTGSPTTPATTPTGGTEDEPLIKDEKLKVTRIDVLGLKTLRPELVLETISTKVGEAYDRAKLQQDINKLDDLGWFYFSGYREDLVKLGYPVPASTDIGSRADPDNDPTGRGVAITFRMVENPTIKQVKLVGNTLQPSAALLQELVFLKSGNLFNTNPEKIERDLRRISDLYSKQGYFASAGYVSPDSNQMLLTPEPDGTVTVTLWITELQVGEISFNWTGSQRTKERVFRSYMRSRPGQYVNFNRIAEDLREIERLDLLDDIKLQPLKVSEDDPTKLNLIFDLTEKRTGNISAGGGYSSRYGLVGFVDISEKNLWGLAHQVSGRVEFGGRFNFSTNYFYPLLDGSGSEFNVRLYNTEDRTGATGIGAFTNRRASFDQTRRGGSVLFSRPILPTLRGSVQYELQNVTTQRRGSQLPNLPPFPFQDLGSDTTSSVTLGLTHDTRDFAFDATKGMYQSATVEIAGLGGDNHFGKYRLETRHFFPVFGGTIQGKRPRPAWVVATRGVYGFSSGRPPFSQAYFVGGAETLRGYSEDRFFGDRMFLFNLELRRSFKGNIQAVAFFDAGRAWFQGEPLDFFNDLASAVGVGLRVQTPVGPIRLDLGFGADGSKTHFSFGQPF
ncbi:MAG: BamA/TamA family outer membrane protein [Fimbriimonadaceae bacterium]|nr:BamA/TamA family outer membrane protein [Fimbriimonadaceae bacterium]